MVCLRQTQILVNHGKSKTDHIPDVRKMDVQKEIRIFNKEALFWYVFFIYVPICTVNFRNYD